MRIAVSAVVFLLALMAGARTQWVVVSGTALATAEDRAYAAVVLGETSPDATSAELVDAAVSRGEISPEAGLLYGVYLACDPARLPDAFRGKNQAAASHNILWQADVDWSALSSDTQLALQEFFAFQLAADATSPCADEVRHLAEERGVWWAAALRVAPVDPGGTTVTASRP